MNMEPRGMESHAETEIAELFDKLRQDLPGAAEVARSREAAFAAFRQNGLPHRRVEDWKYSDLRNRLKSVPAFAAPRDDAAAGAIVAAAGDVYAAVDRYRLVLVDGRFHAGLSDVAALASEGVVVRPLAEALAEDGADLFEVPEIAADNAAIGLNAIFCGDGLVLTIADNTRLSKPVEIVHALSADAAVSTAERVVVKAGAGSEVTLLETFVGGTEGSFANSVSDFRVATGAKLVAARLQTEAAGTTHVGTALVTQDADSAVKLIGAGIGAGFARHQSFVRFNGENSRADLLGITMVRGGQHVDQTLVVDHAVPHCDSRELFKTVVDDDAKGIFQGKIIVRPHAQKTDGQMMTQSLLLSEHADMALKPELEIFADDVQCAHGATSGQIDEDLLFYLRARGIPEAEARTLLVLAFLSEAVEEIGDEVVVEAFEERIRSWLSAKE
ncbi:Fe-S cluster assembly protein SufD [Stappia taiwanensis]|uniref:Fe-S cluster assembly protein SufD n=1 Tax=Stappia taiwanensis TaxID=992267 RepID=A0A838XU79_9HYPH|nr:Fe-S cluster assembly protein SufD [Stappia taiwanensis]MBA4613287.1 Fe-S cluster assembly protein SufD [Stappia taiwanensis]GGE80897.1 Fe-S cluster assembly protein SufD [Stappia taiwanensis]